ncbi:hypothetical protein TrLO_g14298 [Triparma laevis f. longispina]|uniref:N-alpha-acetyltransferase 40 n=1 Tax=Triparma laevis f. longispina TaxID=1714387 RepID=A0A9W7CH27_9STRA|nr:hypothetical protein TrLO_g14298 [Triparma laevis f. longispina]
MKSLYLRSQDGLNETEKVDELFDVSDSRYLVVRSAEDQVVGFTHFRFCYDFDDDDEEEEEEEEEDDDDSSPTECAYIFEIQVDPTTKCGLGRRMMDLVHLLAKHVNLPKITLTVFYANLAAIRFYSKLNYLIDSLICPTEEDETDYFILSKSTGVKEIAGLRAERLTEFLEKFKNAII